MIEKILSQMIVFPCRIYNIRNGSVFYSNENSIFSAPRYSKQHDSFFRGINEEGWSLCPSGFAVYAKFISDQSDLLLVVHGLKVDGLSKAVGKTEGLTVKLPRDKIEKHVSNYLDAISQINQINSDTLIESIHEIRSVNAALYHASYQLQGMVHNSGSAEALARNATALSELISARISLIDALASDDESLTSESKEIAIYRKFDKLHKCFIALGKSKKILIDLTGESNSLIKGDDFTDLIPLLLIDNAFKYSPDNKKIKIHFQESNDFVVCSIDSWGPKIESEELSKIFDRGFRGKNAEKSGKGGSGIGLFFLKMLVHNSEGTIEVRQKEVYHKIKDVPYCETSFIIQFPLKKKIS